MPCTIGDSHSSLCLRVEWDMIRRASEDQRCENGACENILMIPRVVVRRLLLLPRPTRPKRRRRRSVARCFPTALSMSYGSYLSRLSLLLSRWSFGTYSLANCIFVRKKKKDFIFFFSKGRSLILVMYIPVCDIAAIAMVKIVWLFV